MPKKLDLVGQRFGRLIVIEENGKNKQGFYKWKCKCDCGNICFIIGSFLKNGATKSCGCYNREQVSKIHTKHKLSFHPLYEIWSAIKARCHNKKDKAYKNYGGRGIKICDEWLNDFKSFYYWCMDNEWEKKLQVDRRNNDRDYTPDNCRFVTSKENCRNTRKSKIWVVNGKEYPSSTEAAKDLNVSHTTIRIWCGLQGSHDKPPKAKIGCYAYNKY